MAWPFVCRATLFMSDFSYGWSETHWLPDDTDMIANRTKALKLARLRAAMLCTTSTLNEVRISSDAIWRDSLVGVKDNDGFYPGVLKTTASQPYESIRLRFRGQEDGQGNFYYNKNLYLRGVPASFQTLKTTNTLPEIFALPFGAYENELIANWGWIVRDHDSAGFQPVPIYDWTPSGLDTVVTTLKPINYLPGDSVRISYARVWPPKTAPDGVFALVGTPTANTFTIPDVYGPPEQIFNAGYVRRIGYRWVKYADIAWQGWSRRKTGNGIVTRKGRKTKYPAAF